MGDHARTSAGFQSRRRCRHLLLHLVAVPIRDAGVHVQQLADRRPVGVEVEVRGKVFGGRASSESSPASTICITWAAIIDLVMLAMPNWLSTRTSRTPSAEPVAPLHVPSAVITVADIPAPIEGGHVVQPPGMLRPPRGDRVLADVGERWSGRPKPRGRGRCVARRRRARGARRRDRIVGASVSRADVHAASVSTAASASQVRGGVSIVSTPFSITRPIRGRGSAVSGRRQRASRRHGPAS